MCRTGDVQLRAVIAHLTERGRGEDLRELRSASKGQYESAIQESIDAQVRRGTITQKYQTHKILDLAVREITIARLRVI